jgi:hypothetical protein
MSSRFAGRIAALHQRLRRLDYLCSGHLLRRYTVCGTKNCSCKTDPAARHGPYYYWSRLRGKKVVQRVLSRDDAKIVARGLKNYGRAKALLRQWEDETVHALKAAHIRRD